MANIDNELIKRIISKYEASTGISSRNTVTSRNWFRENLRKSYGHVRTASIIKGGTFIAKPELGGLYHFNYDPKHKKTLPIYDTFPLVFPFAIAKDKKGFLGINMHYLAPKLRVAVFTELLRLKTGRGYGEKTKLQLNYSKLMKLSRSKYLKHATKHYLFDHMRSKLIFVDPRNWEVVVSLPSERFVKGSRKKGWAL